MGSDYYNDEWTFDWNNWLSSDFSSSSNSYNDEWAYDWNNWLSGDFSSGSDLYNDEWAYDWNSWLSDDLSSGNNSYNDEWAYDWNKWLTLSDDFSSGSDLYNDEWAYDWNSWLSNDFSSGSDSYNDDQGNGWDSYADWSYDWDLWGDNDWGGWFDNMGSMNISQDASLPHSSDTFQVNLWSDWDWTQELPGMDRAKNWNSWSPWEVDEEADWNHWPGLSQWTLYGGSTTVDWTNWGDWGKWEWSYWNMYSEWHKFSFEEYLWSNSQKFPSSPGSKEKSNVNKDLISVEQYWTNDPELNWCKDDWFPDRVEDPAWAELITEFMLSGNITNWCIFPGQVMVISDFSNVNLNDPNALPRMFTEVVGHCTEGVCRRQMENRKILDPGKFVKRLWRLMEVYKQIGCPECFCDSTEKKELEIFMAITKDYLKNNEFLAYSTTSETPENVATYFNGLKESLGLGSVTTSPEKSYIPLLDMDQAIDGPGQHALQINKYAEVANGLRNFCGK